MSNWKLNCVSVNPIHTRFVVFDPHGAWCGEITLLTSDVLDFAQHVWNGVVNWNDHDPTKPEA